MNKTTAIGILAVFALIIGALVFYFLPTAGSSSALREGAVSDANATISNADDAVIRDTITEFGTKLQTVSLLASTENRTAAMNAAYSGYVTPELLATWYPEGAEALGRYTSSPWPDRIDIVEIRNDSGAYIVEGNVLEVAETDEGVMPAAVYPVTLTMEQRNGEWLIAKAEKGSYSELPRRQTIVGYWECLPHRDTTGPQTMECAFGIAVDQSDGHYAVDTSLMSQYPVDYPTGTKVRVSGVVTPSEQLSSIQKYNIDGIIRATTIEKI